MEQAAWAPPDVDRDRPSAARVYDYLLGGSHNFASDREVAELVLAVAPEARASAHANRAFLRRAVDFLVGAGIRQFLDLGSGIPTLGNVHQVAHRLAPESKIVYVDMDPVAVAHSRAIVGDDQRVVVLQADIRQPDAIMDDPRVRRLLDLSEPVAVLLVALLHFIPDSDRPGAIIARLRDTVTTGSYLVISQVAAAPEVTEDQIAARERYTRAAPVALRHPDEIAAFFEGFTLVEPGLVAPGQWRPESPDMVEVFESIPTCAGVAVKHDRGD